MAALPIIAMGLQFIGQKKEERLQAAEAADNQRLADSAAADAVRRGGAEAAKLRMAGTQLAARQHLAYANSGVDATVGTPAQVQSQTAAMSELDALTVENNALREAWGYKRFGLKFEQQAAMNASRSRNQQLGTFLGMAGAAANAYGKWKYDGSGGGDWQPAEPGSIEDQKAGGY